MKLTKDRKTYIGITAATLLVLVETWLPSLMSDELFATLATMIGTFTGIAFRIAVKKSQLT